MVQSGAVLDFDYQSFALTDTFIIIIIIIFLGSLDEMPLVSRDDKF